MTKATCSAPGCVQLVHIKKVQLCRSHYNRLKYSGDVSMTPAATHCRHCSQPIRRERGKSGPPPMYCSTRCRQLAQYERFTESGKAQAQLQARREATAARPLLSITCLQCGEPKEVRKSNTKFCSNKCATRFRRTNHDGSCSELECHRTAEARGLCIVCWRRWARSTGREKQATWDERRKANYQRRRALKMDLPADNIRPLDVYERDGWVCGLCALPVDQGAAWPAPLSPSLDHILPLSKGGHHVLSNVQLAHLSCNVRKGANADYEASAA